MTFVLICWRSQQINTNKYYFLDLCLYNFIHFVRQPFDAGQIQRRQEAFIM